MSLGEAAPEGRAGSTLTAQQAKALEVAGASVALSAGAGCGKTLVLTERFLRDLEPPDPRPLRSIVALTFTEKAARELRGRVREACQSKLDRGEEPAYWRGVLRGLEASSIGTFHQFCAGVLRRFPIEAGVDPGFGVMEETIAPSIREAALADCLRDWLARRDPDLLELAIEFGLSAVRQALTDLVTDRGGRDYEGWRDRDPDEVVGFWSRVWEGEVRPLMLGRVVKAAGPALELFAAHGCSHPTMSGRIAYLREHLPLLPDSPDPVARLGDLNENAKVQGAGTKAHWPSAEVFESVKKALEALRKSIKSCKDDLTPDPDASVAAAEMGLRFARLATQAVEVFGRAKRRRGELDFDDLVQKTHDLLDRRPDVLATLRSEIEVILVDEFQDTDPLQAKIIDLLAGPEELPNGRVFLVGDTKQSIYRFRGADPKLFRTYRGRFPESGRLDLTDNFRSAPGVIHFVNALFAETFPEPEHRLQPRATGYAPNARPAVEFLWPIDPGEADEGGKTDVARRRRVEARWLARLIGGRLKAGWPIWDPKKKIFREAHQGDVVFLLRTLNDAAACESALAAEGLDYYVVGGTAFFAQQEVLDLINLLTSIEDPMDDLALAGVLRSPFFGVSDAGLYWLATASGGELAAGLDGWERNRDLSPRDRERVGRAARLLDAWRGAKDHLPIATLLDRALDESGYEAALLGEKLGDRKRANCRKLVRIARKFDEQAARDPSQFGLADFVARLRADLRKPPREEQAATTDEEGEAVRLMSIHQAKGLEFPIVVVPDLDRAGQAERDRVVFHPELGPIVNPPEDEEAGTAGPGLGWLCYRELERREEEAEAYRLLYVAVTRARESLILSAGLGPDETPRSTALKLIDARFDRATGELKVDLPDGYEPPRVGVVSAEPPALHVGRRKRPRLLVAARAIERARPADEARPGLPPLPRPDRLDLDPASRLPPAAARLDGLIRSIFADPSALDGSLESVARRAGRAVVPLAGPGLVAEARRRLQVFLGARIARDLSAAVELRRVERWRLPWPEGGAEATVLGGSIDFAARDRQGGWTLIVVAPDSIPEPIERLRLIASAHALGLAPVVRGWLVRLSSDGGFGLRGEEAFDERALERAFEAALAALPGI